MRINADMMYDAQVVVVVIFFLEVALPLNLL